MQNVHGARGRAHTANLLRPVVQLLLLVLVGLVGVGSVWGQSRIPSSAGNYLQTTGTPQNGDSDPFMVVFFQVDANVTDTIYFAIDNPYLDGTLPDQGTDAAGGAVWSYYLMGGDGVLTGSTAKDTTFGNLAAAQSGATQLELLTFDGPGTGSNGWNYFSGVSASQGERIGDYYYFKIIAQAPNGDKNAFRLDASTVNSGTATGIPGVRAFAYAWTLALLNRNGTPWNMYPFVPDNAVGNVEMHFVDFDDQDYGDVYNTSDRTTALATGLPGAQITDGEDRSFPYSVSGETNGTWLVQLTESTNTTNPNTSVFYSAGTNPAEPYRTYSSDYFPAPPDRVTASPVDGTAVADGTGVVRERVYLQLVDSAGNPVPYVRDVHLAVDGSAEIEATSDEAGPLNATARVVSTDSDGVAWVEVSDGTAEDVTLTITTDGITSALPGPTTSSRLPDTGTLGVNDAPTIRFVPDALPTISSASGTSFNEGTSAQAIATVDIAEQGSAPEITATGDIRITIPTTRNVTFAAGATVSLTVTGSGQVDSDGTPQTYSGTLTYENANKTAVIDVLSDFAASDTIAISGLQLDAAADSDSNFFLELDIDNDGVTDSIDDKLIIVRDTASTYTWTGSTDTVWADQTNWDVGDGTPGNDGYPGQTLNTDNVVVPGGLTNNPVLASPETINDLSIGAGAQLSIGGNVLTVDGTTSNEGRLILSGAAGQGAGLTAGGPFDVDSGVIEYAGGGSLQLNVYNDLEISSGTYTLSSALDVNGDLTLSGGTLNDGGQTISVAGDWTRVGTFAANSDTGGTGTVVFDGAGPTVVSGATTFYNLTIATPGKAVRFTSGETTTVNGTFRAVGENGSLVSLSGTTTAAWTLDNAGGTDVVQYVDVAYSDLIGANSVTAYSSNNGGNNDQETVTDAAQWVFSGTTYTWTGASTTDWFTQGNWDIGDGTPGNDGTPTSSDPVIIPNTATAPVLTANATGGNDVRSIRVEIGGSLDLAGFNLTSANGITNLGTIIAQGNETYTGTINSDSGEVVYDGNGVNNALPFGTSYFDLTVTPSTGGGSITFTDGTSVTVNGALTAGDTNGDTVTFTGGVAAPASTVRGTLASTDAGLSLGTLTLTGNATIQTGGGTLSLGPTDGGASLVLDTTGGAGTGAITLGGAIGGATPLASLTVNAKGAVQFPSVTTTGTLDVAAGGAVTDAGALTIGGTATLAVPGNAITLDSTSNDFQGDVTITDGATDATAVTLVDQNAVQFGGASATQTGLTVSAGGAITDAVGASVVVAAGTASFTTTLAGAPITMDSAGNNFPTFAAAATTTSTVTVVDAGALVLGGVDDGAGGPVAALTLTVGAALTDSGPSLVSGTTTINASGANVTLNDAGNDFGTVTATGAAIGLVDASGLDLGSTNASGNLTVTVAAGNLTDSGEVNVGGDTSIAMNDGTAADITLDDNGDTTYTNTFTGAFLLAGANLRNVTVTDDTAIVLQGNTITGTLSVTAGGAITQTGGLVVGGTATFNAGTAAVTLGLGANDFDSDNTGDAVTASSTGAAVSIRDGTGSMTVGAVTAGAEVTLRADGLNLTGAISANGGAANTYLLPDTTTTAVSLGGAAGFDLTQTELLQIAAGTGTIVIGKDAVPTVTAGAVTAGASAAVNIGARNLEIEGASIAVGPNTFTTAGSLALVSAGVIDGTANDATADLSAGTLALTAGTGGTGGIGTGTTIDVAASVTLSADTTGSNANIVLDTIGAVQVALVDAGTGNVTLGAGGAVTTASDDATADISGAVVDVTTAAGGVGASSASVDITATASLAVNTTAANGAVYIDGIGAGGLALALVDAGAGAVVLTAAEIDGVTDDGVADLAGSAISLTTTTANGIGTASPLDLDASGALTVDSTTGNGNVTIDALTALAVATINGGTGTVTLDALATVDDDTATDTTTDITAATLVLTAVDGVGSTQDLDLDVDNVSVTVAGTGASNSIVLQSNNTAATTISQLRTNGADISFTHNTTSTVTVASVAGQEVWSGTGGNGGNISISAPNSTTVTLAGDVDSSGGTGGTLSINGVIVNTAPTVGQGNISVTGGGDVQIAAPVTFNASRTITSNGDIILGAAVATAGGAYDLTLVADNDGDGAGGIWIQAAGKAEAAQNLILRGSRIINGGATATGAPALNPAVQIDADGANAQAESGTNGTGTLTIERNAAAPTQDTDILINGAVVARGGFTVTASRGILLNAATANLSSNNGAVSFTADNDGGNTGGITMADGSSINAGSGTISLAAYDDVTLGGAAAAAGLETTNATGAAVSVTSSNGAILDGGDTGLDIVANGAGAATTLSAATGIGHDGTTSNALEITVADLDAATTANNVEITESDGLTVSRAATGNGDVTLISTTGNIAVGSAATPAISAGTGTATLTATGGAIDDAATDTLADINADTIDLNAASGIGATEALELASAPTITADTTTGAIGLTHAADAGTTLSSASIATGTIDFAQTGGQTLDVTSAVTSTSGTITITNAGANLTATSVSAGTGAAADGDVSLTTTGSGTVLLGSVSAAADTVSVSGAAAISDNNGAANNVTALRWNATADSGMGFGDAIETTIGELNATNATSNTIEVTEADGFTVLQAANTNGDVTLISTTGNVAVDSTGGGVSADVATGTATVTATAGTITATNATAANEVVAATINLNAVNGTIGAGNQLDVNAVTALNADTSTGNGTITVTDTAGDLPLGVVTTGAVGAGTVTLNAAAGSIADTNGATVNVTAGSTVLRALTDIGALASAADVTVALNANAIETQTAAVDVATTNAGSEAAIANSGAALDVAALGVGGANGGFVRIENDGNNLTVDTGASGAVLTNGAGEGLEGNDDIALVTTTSGTITVHDEGAVGVQDIATTGTVYLDAIGAIDDSQGATDLYIAAGTLYLNSDAATDTTARTAVTTLNSDLSGGSGALVINEDSGITLATIATANANVTVTDTGGDIIVGSVNAGSGTVALTASSGSIYDDGDAGVDITAATGTANLNANGVIGTGGNDLETTVANLVVNTGTGNAVMTETDDLVVSGASSVAGNLVLGLNAGNLTQSNTLAVTGTTQITTTGSITLNNAGNDFGGAVSTAGNPTTVTLRDANAIQLGGITTTGGGGGTAIDVATVNGGITVGNTLDASGAATAAVSLVAAGQDSDVTVNAAVTTDTADITITADDSVSIAAATTLSTGAGVAGDIVVTANNATTAGDSGDQVTMAADSVLEAGGAVATGVVTVTANGANAGSVALGDLRGSAVTVSADQAAITDAGAGATNVTTAGTFTADSASGIGTSVNPIETTIATLDAQVTGAGGVYVTETDDVTVTQAQTGNGDVTLVSSGGSLTVDTVVTDTTNDVVTLTAANAIVDGNGATNNVTAFRLNATADSGIGSGDAIETAVGELDLTNTTGNAIEVTEADAVTVTGIVQSGAGSVLVSAGATMTLTDDVTSVGGAITLSATTIDLDDTTDDALAISSGGGGGDVTLNAPVDAVGATADSLTLTAGSGNVVIPSAVGGGARLGALTIASAANVAGDAGATADTGTITAATVTQTAGTGTSRFAQIDTNAAGGVDLNGAAFALNGGVTTTAGGALTVTNSGTLTIADTTGPADTATVDINLDGAFTQDGAGGVSVAGDIATTNDAVSFAAPVTVFGDTGVDAGSATITFGNTVSGTSGGEIEDLTINSVGDTGSVVFNGVIGVGQALEGNLDVVAATDVDLVGIEETGASAAGVSGTVSVAAAGTITLAGTADFRTAGAQDYRATGGSAIGAIMAQTGASTVAAGGNGITFEDLYIDANGVTITIPDGETVTANDIVVYRGTIALTTTPGNAGSGATVQTTASGGGDFVVFGPSYSADDTDRGASANEFAYPPADAGPGLAYTLGGSYTQATGAWGTAPNAAFADLSGATITVGSGGTGDFYVNGADLPATANWTLNVQDNSAANPLANPPFGQPYAVAFYKASVGVEYSQVTGGSISAAEPLPPGANNSAHQNNDYRDGGNNLVYVPDPDGSGPGTATPGWDFDPLMLISAETVKDNWIRLTFNEPVENTAGLIETAVASGVAANGDPYFDTGGTAAAFDATGVDADDALPFSFTTTNTGIDLTTFYVRAPATRSWNTDATGSAASASGTGTDRTGASQTTVPNLSWLKGVFFDAGGHNPVINYTENATTTFAATTDEAGPVLYRVEYGRAAHDEPLTTPYDGHNYYHLFWSEPVSIGSDPGMQSGAATPSQNLRAEDAVGDSTGQGGDIVMSGADLLVDGFFRYDDPQGVGTGFNRGWRTGTAPANALYRRDTFSGGQFTNSDQELRIYLSGYNEDWTAPSTWGGSDLFPGWHTGVPDPKDATTVTVENNAQIVDDAGNQIDYQLAPVGGLTAEPAGATPDPGDTASPWLNAWDVDVPTFSSYTIADADPNVGTSFEIVTGVNATTQLIERFEFHILDNSALDLSNVSDANYFNTPQQPMVDGVWDPQALTDTGNVDYTTDLIHTDTRANEGVRDTTLAYPSDGLTETDAFAIEQVGVTPLRTDVNQAFNTEVNNTLYGVTNVNVANDSYFRLQIDGTAGAHPWGLLTEMYVQYDATVARITDLAGNLLPSTAVPIRAIERTPPTIDLALAIAGESRIYMKFSEPVFGSADRTQTIAYDDFRIVDQSGTDITAPVSLDVIATSQAGVAAGGYEEVFLNLADPLSATDILRARIKPVDQAPIDGSSSIYDKAENVLPVADERRVSDVAIGLVEPVWATDSFGINDAGAGNFRTIRTFDGSETLSRSDITIQARVDASATSLPSSILYGFDIESDLTSSGYWSPTALAGLVEVDETTDVREALPFETDAQLRTFMVPGDASGMNQADMLEFQFRLGPLNAARVTDPTDPRTVAPWKIGLGDGFIVQRNNVTILNNVIYPENGERTVLTYELSRPGMVSVIVFDLAGNVVRTIHRGRQGTGTFRYTWDGRNNSNQIVARGIYFIRVVAPGVDEYRKVIVAKD